MIEEGEGLHQDFKYEVSDAVKIARSLVAFANTSGGKLLIGVDDNGSIKGISSEEEYFMIENAAKKYCKPAVEFKTKEWSFKGRKVLEVIIPESNNAPHKAPDKEGKYKAFVRYNDENILASGVQMKVWQKQNSDDNINITIEGAYQDLFDIFKEKDNITTMDFQKYAGLTKYVAEDILSDFVSMEIIKMKIVDKKPVFTLANNL